MIDRGSLTREIETKVNVLRAEGMTYKTGSVSADAEDIIECVAAAVLRDLEGIFLLSDLPEGVWDGVKQRWKNVGEEAGGKGG